MREPGQEFLWPGVGDYLHPENPERAIEDRLPSWVELASKPRKPAPKARFDEPLTMAEHRRKKDTSLRDILAPKLPQDDPASS